MQVIIGGAYQGKLDYAKEHFGLIDGEICECSEGREPDFTQRCLYHIERYVIFCLRNGLNPADAIVEWLKKHNDAVLICEDMFCGVVPVDEELRAWREATGRLLSMATGKADGVVRIFCGLPQVLK